jgi:peptidoglycan hydrolase-like protein with peptidoglycan-binding domain
MLHPHSPAPAPAVLELTPWRARLLVAFVLTLVTGVAGNALFQGVGGQQEKNVRSGAQDRMVTGLRPAPAPSSASSAAIKTAALPPPATGPVEQEMKRWQARLKQLESEARGTDEGVNAAHGSASSAGAVAPTALEPAIAHRLDSEAVAPVTQQTVRAIQRELTDRGYDPGPADGNIGLLTQASIMAYEHDQGLVLSGEPSERLLRRIILGASTDEDGARPGKAKDRDAMERLIKGVQLALASLKYAPGQTDGALSEETARAIREFEMDQGLVPTGRVSGRLIVRLARASGKAFVVPVK